MIQRHRADGFQIAIENRIRDDSTNALAGEIGKTRAHGIGSARDVGETDKPDPGLALARQHPHQIGIMHRIERMILQRAFVQRHRADEQIALIEGAAGLGKSRRHQHDRLAAIGAQRIHHRADIAGIGGIEGRTDLEQDMRRAAPAQPFLRLARARHRKARFDRAALERHHHRIDFGQRQIVRGHADGLHRAQAAAGQRIGKIGRAGVVVGDAAERQSCGLHHGFIPA